MEHLGNLKKMEQRTLRENVVELLRHAIIDGTFPPGAELNQAHIAEKLGISRGPLREALGQLEQEGLVRNVPYRGVYVTPLTWQYVEELYSIRTVLESFAVKRAIERLAPDDQATLDRIVQEMHDAAQDNDTERMVALDLEFHRQIIEMADHEVLFRIWKSLEIGVLRSLHTHSRIYENLVEVVGIHPKLVQAMTNQDVERAVSLLQLHIGAACEQIGKHWEQSGALPNADGPAPQPTEE